MTEIKKKKLTREERAILELFERVVKLMLEEKEEEV